MFRSSGAVSVGLRWIRRAEHGRKLRVEVPGPAKVLGPSAGGRSLWSRHNYSQTGSEGAPAEAGRQPSPVPPEVPAPPAGPAGFPASRLAPGEAQEEEQPSQGAGGLPCCHRSAARVLWELPRLYCRESSPGGAEVLVSILGGCLFPHFRDLGGNNGGGSEDLSEDPLPDSTRLQLLLCPGGPLCHCQRSLSRESV